MVEPAYSKLEHSEDYWDPSLMTQRFCARMICTDPSCGETVFAIGKMHTDYGGYYEDEEGGR